LTWEIDENYAVRVFREKVYLPASLKYKGQLAKTIHYETSAQLTVKVPVLCLG